MIGCHFLVQHEDSNSKAQGQARTFTMANCMRAEAYQKYVQALNSYIETRYDGLPPTKA